MQRRPFLPVIGITMCLLNISNPMSAQVTIGLDKAPVDGAILQLKEEDVSGPNSKRGLNLPRVSLNDLGKLQMGTDPEYTDASDRLNHAGLVVFNVNEDYCREVPLIKGTYVWTSEEWERLGAAKEETYLDQEGNEFKARRFGAAGIWMTQNLNVKKYADGTSIPEFDQVPLETKVAYTYPNVANAVANPTAPSDWRTSFGLLYTSAAALKSYVPESSVINQQQIAGTIPGANEIETVVGKIQGICPDGWHLPSDREWNELEEAIYNNMSAYSKYAAADTPTPATWDATWETSIGNRPSSIAEGTHAHGLAMASSCLPSTNAIPQGMSMSAFYGGFDGMLLGVVSGMVSSGTSSAAGYGRYGYFWSSSSGSAQGVMLRRIGQYYGAGQEYRNTFVYRAPGDRQVLISVRCKKD